MHSNWRWHPLVLLGRGDSRVKLCKRSMSLMKVLRKMSASRKHLINMRYHVVLHEVKGVIWVSLVSLIMQ